MPENVAFSVGNLAAIDKADSTLDGYFSQVFGGIEGKCRDFLPLVKLLVANKLGPSLSVHRLPSSHPTEFFRMLGFRETPAERNIYRAIERVGAAFALVLDRHQKVLRDHGLISDLQFLDFSSTYFEGKAQGVGDFGYSRDHQFGKRQIVFGVSTGINGIPSALTIQRGNVVDKSHFPFLLRTVQSVLEPNSLLIFDCGANTRSNKARIRKMGFHYLTLRPKKRGPYRDAIAIYALSPHTRVTLKERVYECAKATAESGIVSYIFYSEQLKREQLAIKASKFRHTVEVNEPLLQRTKKGKPLGEYPCREGTIIAKGSLQRNLEDAYDPAVSGLEGYFVLESSVDAEPEQILRLYKERDQAEKLIRDLKEGMDLRPLRHWTKKAVMGYVLIVFLANFVLRLTVQQAEKALVKNGKLLKNYLRNLTVTVVYPERGFRFRVLANVGAEIRSIFGPFVDRYRDKSLTLRW
jgi:transposase